MATIIPRYKLILTYDIQPGRQAEYSQFVMGKFIPGIQSLNLYILGVYHTLYGDYPSRQAEFVAETWEEMIDAVESDQFTELEDTLKDFTQNYARKIVKYRRGFQM